MGKNPNKPVEATAISRQIESKSCAPPPHLLRWAEINETMQDVMEELKVVGTRYQDGDLPGCLIHLHEIWDRLPIPQVAVPNAYLIIEYGVALTLKLHQFDEARVWAGRATEFKEKRHDMGEVEFLIGKVAFESGQLDLAEQQFREARRKSEGRIFHGENPKYIALLKKK